MNIKEEHKVVLEMTFGEYEKFRSIIMNITEESIRNYGLGDEYSDKIIKEVYRMRKVIQGF